MAIQHDISAVILAGGLGRRMGNQDKGLMPLKGRPLIEWVIDAVQPQVNQLFISANRNAGLYGRYGFPVINDTLTDYQGPLAGIAATMVHVKTQYLLCVPCDSPRVSPDLVTRMYRAILQENAPIAVAHDGKREQSVYTLIRTDRRDSLLDYLRNGERKVQDWLRKEDAVPVDFSDHAHYFYNINQPEDLQNA